MYETKRDKTPNILDRLKLNKNKLTIYNSKIKYISNLSHS